MTSRPRRRWVAASIATGLIGAGCSAGAGVLSAQRGSCSLGLASRAADARSTLLRPPYVVGMTGRTPSGIRTAHVEYVATGWQDVDITVRSPAGVNVASAIRWFDRSSFGQGFDAPGLWTIRWVDARAGCEREISVLVLG